MSSGTEDRWSETGHPNLIGEGRDDYLSDIMWLIGDIYQGEQALPFRQYRRVSDDRLATVPLLRVDATTDVDLTWRIEAPRARVWQCATEADLLAQ